MLAVNDPGNRYAVPYVWGTTGIGYDVDKVKAALGDNAPVDSWDLIFREENISKLKSCGVAMLDSPSEIISIALHYLGLPSNSTSPEDYQKAQALLLKIRPYVLYPNANKDATEFVEQKLRDNPWIYPDKKTMATLVPLEPLPLKMERIRTRLWTKVKSDT